jgi:hypothetical protein
MKIHVRKGYYNKKYKIVNTTFTLLKEPVDKEGSLKAIVDASEVLGQEFSALEVTLEDYKII